MGDQEEVARVLSAYRDGAPEAEARLLQLLYPELRRLARSALRRGRPDAPVLDTTALVHEAYLKLFGPSRVNAVDRSHFLGIAARAMRQVIVDYARERASLKRGGGESTEPWNGQDAAVMFHAERVLAINEALERLAREHPRLLRIVECRFFAGYSDAETAEALDVSIRTIERDWVRAKAWLREVIEN